MNLTQWIHLVQLILGGVIATVAVVDPSHAMLAGEVGGIWVGILGGAGAYLGGTPPGPQPAGAAPAGPGAPK